MILSFLFSCNMFFPVLFYVVLFSYPPFWCVLRCLLFDSIVCVSILFDLIVSYDYLFLWYYILASSIVLYLICLYSSYSIIFRPMLLHALLFSSLLIHSNLVYAILFCSALYMPFYFIPSDVFLSCSILFYSFLCCPAVLY